MSRLKLGLVGCGRAFERFHHPALRACDDWVLAGAADPLPERREQLRQIEPRTPVFEDLDGLLAGAAPDAVLITTPPQTHAPLASAALRAGVPVLVEKPMAVDSAGATQMVEASRASGKTLQVGFNRRFREPYRKLREMLEQTGSGTVTGPRHRLVLDTVGYRAVTDYLGRPAGGDVLDDVASHQIDLLPWLFGGRLEAVRGAPHEGTEENGERCAFELRLDGGRTVECFAAHADRYEETLELEISGRSVLCHATGVIRTRRLPRAAVRELARIEALLHLALHRLNGRPNVTLESFIEQLRVFAATVRGSGEQDVIGAANATSGARCVRAIEACRESLAEGGVWKVVA